jgi:hypothetical protein
MENDVTLLTKVDKFLVGSSLSAAEQLDLRQRIAAASETALADAVVEIAANAAAIVDVAADVVINAGDITSVAADVSANTAAIATNAGDIASVAADVSVNAAAIAANAADISTIEVIIEGATAGVSTVAGETGIVTKAELLAAINVEDGADVTDATNIASSIASVAEKVTPVDDDKIPGLDSEAAGILKWFKISSIVTKAKALFDTLYASTAQGVLAGTAVQPNTSPILASLQLAPTALSALPTPVTAGEGAVANISDGSVDILGEIALDGGAIVQRVRSNGTNWIVDSGIPDPSAGVTDHGALDGLADDDHVQYLRVDGTRAGTGMQELAGINFKDPTTLQITGGAAVATQSLHFLSAYAGATDELHTVTAANGVGDFLFVTATTGHVITVLHNTGNIKTFNGLSLTVTETSPTILIRMGDDWLCIQNIAPSVLVDDATPQLGGILDTNSHQVRFSKGIDVASAATLVVGDDGNSFVVTGVETISAIASKPVGTTIRLRFADVLQLNHSANLDLPTNGNITTVAGDVADFEVYNTAQWRCVNYTRRGAPLDISALFPVADSTALVSDATKQVGLDAGPVTAGQTRRIQSPDGDSRVRDVLSWVFTDLATTGVYHDGILLPAGFRVENITISARNSGDVAVYPPKFKLRANGAQVGDQVEVQSSTGISELHYGQANGLNTLVAALSYLQVECVDDASSSTASSTTDCTIHVKGHWAHE